MFSDAPVIDTVEIENALCQISEVDAVRIVNEDNNLISELHVLSSGQKAPRQLVRDIESLLITRFGIAIDHKKISIAHINNSQNTRAHNLNRLRISNINIDVKDFEAAVEVKLTQNESQCAGVVKGPASKNGRLRLVALATLDAVLKSAATDFGLALEHISVIHAGSVQVAVACVTVMTKVGEITHSGSAIVKGNESDAVAKAALDAINRYLAINRI